MLLPRRQYPAPPRTSSSFELGGLTGAQITGNTITKYVPQSIDITGAFRDLHHLGLRQGRRELPSGSVRDFSTAQTYTITAENNTTKVYTVNVIKANPITYTFDNDLQWLDADLAARCEWQPVGEWRPRHSGRCRMRMARAPASDAHRTSC